MDKPGFSCLWVLLALLAVRASAACASYGVDYASSGSYSIDGTSNQYFSFITVFQGKPTPTHIVGTQKQDKLLTAEQDAPRRPSAPFSLGLTTMCTPVLISEPNPLGFK